VSIQGAETDPVHAFPFTVSTTDAVVTAGSCFAQHISRRLAASGYKFLITEAAHPFLEPDTAAAFNYGRFTARYGNIYTARQLLQLFHRAYGTFTPVEDAWRTDTGAWIDPFRPQIQPGGFPTEAEYRADREQHFAAVRTAFETADVFIFTLGLTECWEHAVDGAAFPICPGTSAGGVFDPEVHRFANHSVSDVIEDMEAFFGALRAMNPQVRVILTVSPVPLVATARDAHVLVATTYSKSVLRVAAETLVSRHEKTGYFPSYEIITGPQSRGGYFEDDLRDVRAEGVDRVMSLFFQHVCETSGESQPAEQRATASDDFFERAKSLNDALCDELLLDDGSSAD
jgi:hypothetical protein